MPKMKTHKGAKKRIHVTGSGKLMRRKRILGTKSKAKKRSRHETRRPVTLSPTHNKVVKQMIPRTKGSTTNNVGARKTT